MDNAYPKSTNFEPSSKHLLSSLGMYGYLGENTHSLIITKLPIIVSMS